MGLISAVESMGRKSFRTPLKGVEQLVTGKWDKAFKTFKSMPGEANRSASKIAHKVGIRGWVGKHPNESIGALVAMIYGGWAAAGAYGGAAAGGGGAAAGGGSGAAGAAGGSGGGIFSSLGGMFGSGGSGASGATGATGATGASGGGFGSGVMNWLGGSSFGGSGAGGAGGGGGMSNFGMLQAGSSALSSIGSFITGNSEAKAMQKAQKEQWKQQMINTREQYRQLGQAEQFANQEYHDQLIQNQASLMQQRGQVELLAGATHTGGASINSMLSDLTGQAGRNQAAIINDYENQVDSFINTAKAIQSGGQMEQRSFNKPSAWGSLASGVMNATSAYMSGAQKGQMFADAFKNSRTYSSGLGS